MKTTHTTPNIFLVFIFLFLTSYSALAATHTWNGGTSTDWNTASNWSGSTVPISSDDVIIQSGTFNCLLAANTTVNQFTLTSDTIDLNGFILSVSSTATFTTGFLTNGTLNISGSTTSFNGGTIAATVNVSGNSVRFSGSTFSGAVTAVKKGSGTSTGNGGCSFSSTVTLTDSGTGSWTFANTTADTWTGKVTVIEQGGGTIFFAHNSSSANSFSKSVTFTNLSSGTINCDYYGNSTFHDSIIVNSTNIGDIRFGFGNGITTLDTSIIVIGSTGFSSSGLLRLRGIHQNDATKAISLTMTGTSQLYLESLSSYSGTFTASVPVARFNGSRFLNTTAVTLTTSVASGYLSLGASYFGGSATITKNFSGTGTITLGSASPDTFATTTTIRNQAGGSLAISNALFNGKVIFKNEISSSSDRFLIATAGTCEFQDSVTFDNSTSGMTIGFSAGSAIFQSSSYLYFPSSFTGNLKINNLTQSGSHTITIPFQSNSNILSLISGNTFNGNFNFTGQRILFNGTTFNGNCNIIKMGSGTDTCSGGNVFNGTTVINDSAAGQTLTMAQTTADDFNGNVTFKQYGSGTHLYPAYTKNTTFGGDVTVDGSAVIAFGNNGGKVIFDGSKGQSLIKTGSYVPSFKRIEINSSRGYVSLGYPLTLADSLTLISGILTTDTTNLLTVADNIIVSGGTDSSYIYGPVKKIGNDAFTFPLGDSSLTSGAYHPLGISAPSTTGAAYTARYYAQGQSLGSTKVDSIGYLSTCEYWTLNRNADTCQIKPTLWWNTNSCNVDTSTQRVAYYNATQWVSLGKGTKTGNPSKGSVSAANNVNLFGTFTLAQLCNITADITSSHGGTICAGVSDTITATPSGLTSYQFFKNGSSVQTGSSDKYISSTLTNGDVIRVKATNAGSCFSYDSITMMVNSLPSVSITTDSATFCKGQTHTLTASGTGLTSYLWSGGATTSTRTVNAAGTYTITVSNGTCSNTTSQVIALYDTIQPTITVIGSTVICTGSTTSDLQATLSGAVNYLWSTTETTSLITVEDSATYQVTCLDAHGCYVHNWQVITQANTPEAPIVSPSGTVHLCTADEGETVSSVTLHVTNYDSDLLWSTSETTQEIDVSYEDLFNVTYTDPISGCYSASSAITSIISTNSILPDSITTNKTGNEICKGDSITLTQYGGILGGPLYVGETDSTYWGWYIGACGDSLIGTGDSITVHPTEDTKYYLRADGPCGTVCDSVMVYCMSIIIASTDITCPGSYNGTAKVTVSGGSEPYEYVWSPRAGGSVSIWDLSVGTYFVSVSDSLGCTIIDSTSVNIVDSMHLSIYSTTSACHDSTGTAKIVPTGGTPEYYYFWKSTGESLDSLGNLAAGVYDVTVSDLAGCSVDTSVIISDEDGPDVDIDSLTNVKCNGFNDGFVSFTVDNIPVEELVAPCGMIPNSMTAGSFPFIISDSSGCKTVVQVTINEPPPITLTITTSLTQCGDSTGTATVFVSGGTAPYSYDWSSGGSTFTEINLTSGFDTIYVTDSLGCKTQSVTLITDSGGIMLSHSVTDVLCHGDSTGRATISVSGGTSPYTYYWSPEADSAATDTSLMSGTYIVTVKDAIGCIGVDTFVVEEPEIFSTRLLVTLPIDTVNNGIMLTEASGGVPPYNYSWSPGGETARSLYNVGPGSYSVTIKDNNQCTSLLSYLIPAPCGTGCNSSRPPLCPYVIGTDPTIPTGITTALSYPITIFGAVGNGVTNDECAFEKASYFINELYNQNPGILGFTLTFPAGTYIVGTEDAYNTFQNLCWLGKGHTIFQIGRRNDYAPNNTNVFIHNLSFVGTVDAQNNPTSIIKYEDCMRYGAFDPATGDRYLMSTGPGCPTGPAAAWPTCNQIAFPGTLFQLENCYRVTISGLDLDGNIDHFSIGGYIAFEPISNCGILMGNACRVRLENVFVHDFSKDGLSVPATSVLPFHNFPSLAISSSPVPLNLVMVHCKFNNNHRTGFAWDGGRNVFATECEFNYNAQGFFRTATGSGMDLEWELPGTGVPNQDVRNGHFTRCEFKGNYVAGVICDRPSYNGITALQGDYFFDHCEFNGSEFGSAIATVGRNFNYTCCNFNGHVANAYDGTTNAFFPTNFNTKFDFCYFNEEYTDPLSGVTYSFTHDLQANPSLTCGTTTANIYTRPTMLFLYQEDAHGNPCGRVSFSQCFFNTNYHNSWGNFRGGFSSVFLAFAFNYQHFSNCIFANSGQCGKDCNICGGGQNRNLGAFDQFVFANTKFFYPAGTPRDYIGGNNCYFIGVPQTHQNPPNVPDCIMNHFSCNQATFTPQPDIFPLSFSTACAVKYQNPTFGYPWQLTSSNCNAPYFNTVGEYCLDEHCTSYAPPGCCLSCRISEPIAQQEESGYLKIYPSPVQSVAYVEHSTIGDLLILRNIVGAEVLRINSDDLITTLNLETLSPGIYFLQVNSEMVKLIKL